MTKHAIQHHETESKFRYWKEVQDYIRIGDDYLKKVSQPNRNGGFDTVYTKRSKSTITDDFSREAIKYIKKYEGFVSVPSHTNYQQEISGFFNKYAKLSYEPKDGDFDHILQLLRHIFGEHLFFILDYFQLLYTRPQQRLPIILLESKERGTGKSTFGSLVCAMFQDNAIKLGNSDLDSLFNSIWIEKLSVVVDETSLEKNGIMQMLKRLSTETGKVTSNEKQKAQIQIEFIGKFVFMSNEEGKALPIEKGETRFAVFKVPTFSEKGTEEITDMEEKIKAEIPAFVYHLLNRKLYYPETSRMFFDLKVYQTQQLEEYFKNAYSPLAKTVINLVFDYFQHFSEINELKLSLRNIQNQLKNDVRSLERESLRKVVENELSIKQDVNKGLRTTTYYKARQAVNTHRK